MNILRRHFLLSLFVLSLLAAGCGEEPRVEYGDPAAVETVTSAWGSSDLQNTAESMTQSLLDSRWVSLASAPPKVRLRQVVNQTDEHIDTRAITDKIRIRLLQSGKVRFLADTANMDQVFEERDFTEAVTRRGDNKLLTDTDYIVTGTVRSIRKVVKGAADVYYLITLELVDPQSGEIVWADEKEIRKTSNNPKIGW
ncbi:MAG: penicillin-binding protein activator LpoB [Deltaproteobacteria bacterium]|jgi:uncharacterized protein (TIGR02722 family)|nr:penicillin-binding protein activator LpoB [Deltaproteobacteria bacterium]